MVSQNRCISLCRIGKIEDIQIVETVTVRSSGQRKKKEENSFPVTCPRGVAPVTSPHRQLFQQTLLTWVFLMS
jgi:hypothetical protein